jgi:hypothetical protein
MLYWPVFIIANKRNFNKVAPRDVYVLKWRKIIVKVLAGAKFQKFNDAFVNINTEAVLAVF